MDTSNLGRVVLAIGLLIAAAGAWMATGRRLSFGSLPGDISGGNGQFGFAFPIVSCIVISVLLTVIINFVIRR